MNKHFHIEIRISNAAADHHTKIIRGRDFYSGMGAKLGISL
jgi:hypothetical protein